MKGQGKLAVHCAKALMAQVVAAASVDIVIVGLSDSEKEPGQPERDERLAYPGVAGSRERAGP